MFEQPTLKDRIFIPLLVIAVVGAMLAWRHYVNRSQAGNLPRSREVLYLEAIEDVYECERDGQRVLTDRPCQTGVPVKVLRSPAHAR